MLRRYYFWWLLLSGIIGFALGVAIKTTWEESKFIIGEWDENPIVVICPDSEVTNYRVSKAVEWWAIRGYEIDYIHRDKSGTICDKGKWSDGIIFIRAEGELLPGTYAMTSRLTILNKMISAEIVLRQIQAFHCLIKIITQKMHNIIRWIFPPRTVPI